MPGLERAGVVLLLLAALVPRMRDVGADFDRELEGFQGAFFAGSAVNYERFGVLVRGGYPVLGPDHGSSPTATTVYANHPPTVALVAWAALKVLGPDGWQDGWKEGLPPEGVEPPLRLPFLAFHLLGLFAFWWALRQASGPRLALLGLAILCVLPVSALYGTLVNYENPSLAFVLLGCGFHARFLRSGRGRDLAGLGLSFLAAGAVTYAPLFFVPPLVLQYAQRRLWRRGLRAGATMSGGVLAPLIFHGIWVRIWLPEHAGSVWTRGRHLIEPLFDGSAGSAPLSEWAARQWGRMELFFSEPILYAACAGLVVVAWSGLLRRTRDAGEVAPLSLAPPLFLGGFLMLLGFYRHTFDGPGPREGQTVFLLNLAPACAVLAAHLLDALAPALYRLKGGIAPLVVATGLIGMPGLARLDTLRNEWRAPGPRDDPALEHGPPAPLPRTVGDEIRALLPAGAIGLHPIGLDFTAATSFYAWRTLLPVSPKTLGDALGRLKAMGLKKRDRYLLLPKDPPDPVREQVDEMRARALLAGMHEPAAEDEHWELWPLQ
ncbi:MAG: glycosyltransferase family 39 protein [Planctomycetota bacterium]|nr:glycosyltransferase family 39 protein [Planctomycetota bacterium]